MKKNIIHSLLGLLLAAALLSCQKDNYDPPGSQLQGKLHYKGDAIHVEVNQVPFQLYQFGFGKVGPISGTVTQDGMFSALLFDGNYKLLIPANQGPFVWKKTAAGAQDSVTVVMKGSQTLDIEVTPYYMIRDAEFTAGEGKVNATFRIEKIITDAGARNIERVNLYINKTTLVSGGDYNIAGAQLSGSQIADPASVTMSVNIPAISPAQNYVFARVGLKVAGVEDMIFSPVQKLNF